MTFPGEAKTGEDFIDDPGGGDEQKKNSRRT